MADQRAGPADGAPAGDAAVAQATRALLARLRAEAGADVVAGWKIGINDPRMLRRLGLGRPIVGALRRDAWLADGPVAAAVEARVAVEVELALYVARDVPAGRSAEAAARALAGVAPALEVLDFARLAGDLAGAIDANVFHVAALLPDAGAATPPQALAGLRVVLEGPGGAREADPGPTLAALGEIAALVADRLEAAGERLRAGACILSGAFAPPVALAPGEQLVARFGAHGTLRVVRDPERVRGALEGGVQPG